jgi:hypothetical protein
MNERTIEVVTSMVLESLDIERSVELDRSDFGKSLRLIKCYNLAIVSCDKLEQGCHRSRL